MAQITINEISANYGYAVGTNSFATVALPITAQWGPGYFASTAGLLSSNVDESKQCNYMSNVSWDRYASTSAGMEAFLRTYRGPTANFKSVQDYSYHQALTLLNAGYDVLVCRVSPGERAKLAVDVYTKGTSLTSKGKINLIAKYPGTFGNNLYVQFKKKSDKYSIFNVIIYTKDSSGVRTTLENNVVTFNIDESTDFIPYYREVESAFIDKIEIANNLAIDNTMYIGSLVSGKVEMKPLEGGTDREDLGNATAKAICEKALQLAAARYFATVKISNQEGYDFKADQTLYSTDNTLNERGTTSVRYLYKIYEQTQTPAKAWGKDKAANVHYREWLYTAVCGISYYEQGKDTVDNDTNIDTGVYALLKDKLKYNAQRVISPGWDDQDLLYLDDILYPDDIIDADEDPIGFNFISPIHARLMDVGYWARCTAALLDIPRSISRCKVYIDQEENTRVGYAQKLARMAIFGEIFDASVSDVGLYPTHSALFAPWGQYKYVKMAKMNMASPAFLALMIHRSQIKGQADQYEWILPRNRQHTLNIGKMDYIVPKKLMDLWQSLEGVGVNIITDIPGLGTNLWGNSTLYEVPEATYQALANLSTRYLVNAIENQAYNAGIGITYTYNNNQAYEQFYAGVTPLLDTMKNLGAIVDYYVKMEADINGLDRVNANTVLGKIYITPVGVINDIVVDLIALPPSVSLDEIRAE